MGEIWKSDLGNKRFHTRAFYDDYLPKPKD